MLFDQTLRDLLERSKTIAILGAKDKPGSPVDRVGRYLLEAGYTILPVHPVRKSAWGIAAVKSLAELEVVPDIVCLFRASEYCAEHAREVMALPDRPLLFWMQEGVFSPEAGTILAGTGIGVVEDLCLKTEHQRLFGNKTVPLAAAGASTALSLPTSLSESEGVGTCGSKVEQDDQNYFRCRRCGHCCEGRGGIVVGPRDLPRLAAFFHLSEKTVLDRHTETRSGKPTLLSGSDHRCLFFREEQGCTIHSARPDVCRAWPYFRGNLVDESSFRMAGEDCPGIDTRAAHADFAHEGFSYLVRHGLLGKDRTAEGRALIVREEELPPLSSPSSGDLRHER